MKKTVALLMALVLMLTAACPALALSQGEMLKLAVLGDSISYGEGLIEPKPFRYGTLVAKYFDGASTLNLAQNGYECKDLLYGFEHNNYKERINSFQANCYVLSVGSNDYLEFLADYIFLVSTPEESFYLPYNDLPEFFEDVLITHTSGMTDGILRFLHADQNLREEWKNEFCDTLETNLEGVIQNLHDCNEEAPILLLNYYSPGDPYMSFANKASALLSAINRNINDTIGLMDRARTAGLSQKMALLSMIRTKLVMLSADIYLFVPLLKEFDLDLTKFSPLLALAGVGFVGIEALSQNRTILDKLGEITELAAGLNQLIQFTHEMLLQMNDILGELARSDRLVIVIDVAEVGMSAENISPFDHFHPSEQGQQIIADKMIAALETIYAGGTITPPAPERTGWIAETIAFFREWLDRIFR